MEKTNTPITLTPDQIIALVGHGATQEQLDGVRRELDAKIDRLSDKIDKVHTELDGKINRLDTKIDSKFNQMLAVLLANIAGMVALAYWLGSSQ
jgi:hypothetical protein